MQTAKVPIALSTYPDRAQRHKDGSVLLSIADDRICKLNGVGALTWMMLEANPVGLSVDDVVCELTEQFAAINAEGQLRYVVSRGQLRTDTDVFLKKLTASNLLRVDTDSRVENLYYIREGISSTTSKTVVARRGGVLPAIAAAHLSHGVRLLRRETLAAFVGLLIFDLLLKFHGFQSLIKRVEHWPIAEGRSSDPQICRRVRAMIDRAQMYYPKKAMCLQRSAVTTCLLRSRGLPAELVLGAQEYLPKAHAWAEVNGVVVNDSPAVNKKYRPLRRV